MNPAYKLRSDQATAVRLFNNLLAADSNGNYADLRGSQPLAGDHVIEWSFLQTRSSRIAIRLRRDGGILLRG